MGASGWSFIGSAGVTGTHAHTVMCLGGSQPVEFPSELLEGLCVPEVFCPHRPTDSPEGMGSHGTRHQPLPHHQVVCWFPPFFKHHPIVNGKVVTLGVVGLGFRAHCSRQATDRFPTPDSRQHPVTFLLPLQVLVIPALQGC